MSRLTLGVEFAWGRALILLLLLATLPTAIGGWIQNEDAFGYFPGWGESQRLAVAPQTTGLTISGLVYFDGNGNGVLEEGEPGIEGVAVELRLNNAMVSSALTNANGQYSFANLSTNSYSVVESNAPGFVSSTPDTLVVSLGSSSVGDANFGDYIPLSVIGTVFNDRNENGFQGLDEEGIPGAVVEIYQDVNGNGQVDAGDILIVSVISDGQGNYALPNISPGNRVLRISPPGGMSSPGGGQLPLMLLSSDAGGNTRLINLPLVASLPLLCTTDNLIDARFNDKTIANGAHIWFSSHLKVRGLGSVPATISFEESRIKFSVGATQYELPVPKGAVTFSTTATNSTTSFDATQGWSTTVSPANAGKYAFLSGLAFPVPAGGLPGKISPVTWTGRFATSQPGLVIEWAWSAAVYSQFNSTGNALGIKPVDGSLQNPYANGDQAGSPQNYKSFVIAGARGKGGNNYTGDWSDRGYAAPCASPDSLPYFQRVNAGSVTYTDSQSGVWSADKSFAPGSWGYSGGSAKTSNNPVDGSEDDLLYQRYRENMSAYSFSAAPGLYAVTLRFAEFVAKNATERVMKITIEGNVVENGLSIFGQTGGRNIALERSYEVNLTDGVLNVLFARQSGSKDPVVSAIEVRSLPPVVVAPTATPTATATPTITPTPTATATPLPYSQAVNSGSTSYTDSGGQVWASDRTYQVGGWGRTDGAARSSSSEVSGSGDDQLYQRYIEKPGEYRFTLPNGTYEVIVKLAEFVAKNSSERVMSITLEGSTVESGLSIFGRVGKNAALDLTYEVVVQDGILNVGFVKAAGSAKEPVVNAISVRRK